MPDKTLRDLAEEQGVPEHPDYEALASALFPTEQEAEAFREYIRAVRTGEPVSYATSHTADDAPAPLEEQPRHDVVSAAFEESMGIFDDNEPAPVAEAEEHELMELAAAEAVASLEEQPSEPGFNRDSDRRDRSADVAAETVEVVEEQPRYNCPECDAEDVTPSMGTADGKKLYHTWYDGNGIPTACGPVVPAPVAGAVESEGEAQRLNVDTEDGAEYARWRFTVRGIERERWVPLAVEAAIRASATAEAEERLATVTAGRDIGVTRQMALEDRNAELRAAERAANVLAEDRAAERNQTQSELDAAEVENAKLREALAEAIECIDSYVPTILVPFKVADWRALASPEETDAD